ncbi:uncharacterized protein LOC121412411 [Lytechinus variegatus]|uniref:uncharacterized protein LOC121412411 n=1 Tax=Lytechinus variegatus TaxID=7654 RepID=UPI001BB1FA23|nr:uncharacterized protein LOC121412411 [Lytechinus variegatus]
MREIEISDTSGHVSVCLWGEKSGLKILSGEEVTIGPVTVGLERSSKKKRLNSVKSTCIERNRYWTCVVEAASELNVYPMELLIEGGECLVLEKDYGVRFSDFPVAIVIERDGDKIVSVELVNEVEMAGQEADVAAGTAGVANAEAHGETAGVAAPADGEVDAVDE